MEPQDGGVDETIQWEEKTGEGGEQALQAGDGVLLAVEEGSLQQIQVSGCIQGPLVDEETAIEKLQVAGDGDVSGSGGENKAGDVSGNKDVWRVARDGDGENKAEDVSGNKDVWRAAHGDDGERTSEIDEVELSQPSRQLELIEVGGGASTVAGLVQPGVGGETALVMSPHIHAVPRDSSGFLQPDESSDGGETEGSLRYKECAGDGVEGQDRGTGQTVAGFMTGSVDQTVAGSTTGSVDQTVEVEIRQRPGDDGRSQSPSQFPALDNVHLESDDDGDSGSRLEENAAQDGEDPISSVSGHRDLHQEFPLNYQNYKVCRELSPGVKQCLILETGEQYIYVSEHKPTPDGSWGPFSEDVELDRPGLQPGSDYYHLHSAPVADWDGAPVTARVPNDAEMFASLQDSGRGVHSTSNRDNSQQSQTGNSRVITFSENATGNDGLVLHAEEGMWEPRVVHEEEGMSEPSVVHEEEGMSEPRVLHEKEDMLEPRVVHEEEGMSEPRLVHAESGSAPSGEENERSDEQEGGLRGMDLVEDVLGSEAETSQQSSSERAPSLKKSRRAKPERFVELQPQIVTVFADDSAGTSESDANNNSNGRGRDGAINTNDNAISRSEVDRLQQRGDVSIRSSHYPSDRPYQADRGDQAQPYDHYKTGSRGVSTPGSRTYSQTASRESSYFDSRGQRSGEGSPYYRSRDPSSADTSQLSTRYTRVERGDARSWQTKPESVTIPKFKTLHDQQVNWLEMFKMIEQQHRSELQSQYQEHQKILQEMQRNMEKELVKQQDTLKQRLLTHREMLEELSPGLPASQNVNQSWMKNDRDSLNSRESSEHAVTNNTSRITLQGVPVSLRNPPPVTRYHHDARHHKAPDELPVKRSLDKELSSPVRPADTSLNLSSQAVSIDRDKHLRGGVYSSPFPLAKVKHKRSPRGSKSYENMSHESSRDEVSHNTNSVHWEDDWRARREPCAVSADVSLTESEEAVSPRTRVRLEEKHAKQLAELQAYYEKELQALRVARAPGSLGGTAVDKILANENQELQEKCRQLQEAYHDAKIEIRELQQKIQGLEIRSADYAERYSATQSQVLTLKSRLEELADYAREKEAAVADLSNKDRKSAESLQVAHKKEKELTESLHNAKSTIQKLVDKYEILEKDHDVLKETSAEMQGKLYNSRAELVETNNKLSRLEVENKHLKRDVESLRQHLSMAQGPVTMHTSYEDSYHKAASSPDRAQSAYSSIHMARNRSPERSYNGHSGERHRGKSDISPESDSDNDLMQSPIMKAERELKKLQVSPEFAPKLQRKFYGTERPSSYIGPPITVDHSHSLSPPHSAKVQSPQDKGSLATSHARDSNARPNASISAYFSRSQLEGSRLSKDSEKTSSYQIYKDANSNRNPNISHNRSGSATNGLTSEQAIERVKSGEIVSRPAWEDIYTSLTPARRGGHESKGSPLNHARDQLFRERLQNIENLEKKYDDLTNEKRKHEAALSKLPGHGQGRERDRLESELDRVDRELGSVRMSLKRYHVLKSTI